MESSLSFFGLLNQDSSILNDYFFKNLIDIKQDAFFIFEKNGKIISSSNVANQFFGFDDLEDVRKQNIEMLIPGICQEIKHKNIKKDISFYGIKKNRKRVLLTVNIFNAFCLGANLYIAQVFFKRDFEEIQEAQSLLKYLICSTNEVVLFRYNTQMQVEWISQNCEKLMGFTPDEIIGKNGLEFFSDEISQKYYKIIHAHQKAYGKISSFSALCKRKDGSKIWVKFLLTFKKQMNSKDIKGICLAVNVDNDIKIKEAFSHTAIDAKNKLKNMLSKEKIQKDGYILVAEDEGTDQMILMAYLSYLGYNNFEIIENGKSALMRLTGEGQSSINYLKDKKPILFLCDYKLLTMDGDEVISSYINHCKKEKIDPIPIIACSADGTREVHQKLKESGANDIIIKPITIDNLRKVILKYI
jgi:PAS domain S-box-containing protein